MSHVTVGDRVCQLHLNGQSPAVSPREDKVDLVVSITGPQVAHRGLGSLGRDSDAKRHQGLKQSAEHAARPRPARLILPAKERARGEIQQSRSQRWIRQMMLRSLTKTGEPAANRHPCRNRVKKPDAGQRIPVGDGRRTRGLIALPWGGGVQDL